MGVATTDIQTPRRDGTEILVPMAADAVIKTGWIVCTNADGFAVPGATATGLSVVGRAEEAVSNTGGDDGDQSIIVSRKRQFYFSNSATDPVTQAQFGDKCYIEDNNTVAATDGTGTRSIAGLVYGIDDNGVWVEMF